MADDIENNAELFEDVNSDYSLYYACKAIVGDMYIVPILIYSSFLVASLIVGFIIPDRLYVLLGFALFCLVVLSYNIAYYCKAIKTFEYRYCEDPENTDNYIVQIIEPYNKNAVIECVIEK